MFICVHSACLRERTCGARPYYEDPRLRFEKVLMEAQKGEQAGDRRPEAGDGSNPQLTTDKCELGTEAERLEVQDGAEAILEK